MPPPTLKRQTYEEVSLGVAIENGHVATNRFMHAAVEYAGMTGELLGPRYKTAIPKAYKSLVDRDVLEKKRNRIGLSPSAKRTVATTRRDLGIYPGPDGFTAPQKQNRLIKAVARKLKGKPVKRGSGPSKTEVQRRKEEKLSSQLKAVTADNHDLRKKLDLFKARLSLRGVSPLTVLDDEDDDRMDVDPEPEAEQTFDDFSTMIDVRPDDEDDDEDDDEFFDARHLDPSDEIHRRSPSLALPIPSHNLPVTPISVLVHPRPIARTESYIHKITRRPTPRRTPGPSSPGTNGDELEDNLMRVDTPTGRRATPEFEGTPPRQLLTPEVSPVRPLGRTYSTLVRENVALQSQNDILTTRLDETLEERDTAQNDLRVARASFTEAEARELALSVRMAETSQESRRCLEERDLALEELQVTRKSLTEAEALVLRLSVREEELTEQIAKDKASYVDLVKANNEANDGEIQGLKRKIDDLEKELEKTKELVEEQAQDIEKKHELARQMETLSVLMRTTKAN